MDEPTTPPVGLAAPPPPPEPVPLPELSAEEIFGQPDLTIVPVDVPEWRARVHLRVLPADVGLALNDAMQALPKDKSTDAMFLLLRATLCRSNGAPLITSDDQAGKLRSRSMVVLSRLQEKALELQGWKVPGQTEKNA